MNAQTRHQWSQFYRTFQEPRSFTKTIDIERTLAGYSCAWEVSVKQWENNEREPSIECVSSVTAFDQGGHQVYDRIALDTLDKLAEIYAKDHIDELLELIEKANKE